jgi:hypothetical protein
VPVSRIPGCASTENDWLTVEVAANAAATSSSPPRSPIAANAVSVKAWLIVAGRTWRVVVAPLVWTLSTRTRNGSCGAGGSAPTRIVPTGTPVTSAGAFVNVTSWVCTEVSVASAAADSSRVPARNTRSGVTGAVVAAGLGPRALVAVTANVYSVPAVRPVTSVFVAVEGTLTVRPPGWTVTV